MKRLALAALTALLLLPATAFAGDDDNSLTKRLDKGLVGYESDDFSAFFHARAQFWGGWVGDDSLLSNGSPMQESGFRIRRARLGVGGKFLKDFSYKVELELFDAEKDAGPLYKAWVDYNPTNFFGVRLGADKFLLMKSDIMSSAMLPHLDRPMGTLMMSPSNTLGLVLYSEPWDDHLKISLGLFNGLRRHSSSLHAGYEGVGISNGNQFDGLALAARIDLEPLAPLGDGMADLCKCKSFRLGLGAGYHTSGGDHDFIGGGNLSISAVSAYLRMKVAGFHLFGEFAQEWVAPSPRPTTSTSEVDVESQRYVANVSLGYVILRNTLGVAVRGELIEPNTDVDDHLDEWVVAGTLNYYLVGDYLKAQLEYQHRASINGNDPANDTILGAVQASF